VMTNLVMFEVVAPGVTPAEVSARLAERGVLINPTEGRSMRAVTHYGIERADVERAAQVLHEVMRDAM
jgi:threonine aldolase